MLLIELLQSELKEWPVRASHVVSDVTGSLHFTEGGFPVQDERDELFPWTVLGNVIKMFTGWVQVWD